MHEAAVDNERGAPRGLQARRYKSLRTIAALMLREMSTTYGRSVGGYVWAILEPVGAIAILSIGFSLLFRTPSLGTNFMLFFASGYLVFALFQQASGNSASAIRFSRPLMAYPVVTFMDAILARFALVFLTQVMVFTLVISGIHIVYGLRSILDIPQLLLALALSAGLGLGVGVLNCYLMTAYPIWENIWKILTRPLFIMSGVLFILEDLSGPIRDILWYNPLIHAVGISRRGIYATYDAAYVSVAYVAGIALFCGAFGFLLLYRHHKTILNA